METRGTTSPQPKLFNKYEENGEYQADEGCQVVPLYGLALEKEHHYHRKDGERDHLLNNLELKQVEGTSVADKTDTVSRHSKAIFKKCYSPREQDDQYERPSGGDFHFAEFKMPVPGEGHEDVGKDQHHYGPDSVHFIQLYGACGTGCNTGRRKQ